MGLDYRGWGRSSRGGAYVSRVGLDYRGWVGVVEAGLMLVGWGWTIEGGSE